MAGSQNAVELLKQAQNVGFVDFTKALVEGVFNTVLQTYADQAKTFGQLVDQVSKSVAAYQLEVSGIDFTKPATDSAVVPKLESYIAEVLKFDTSDAAGGKYPIDEAEFKLLENHFGNALTTSDLSKLQPPVGTTNGEIAITYLNEKVYNKIKAETVQQYDLLIQILEMGPQFVGINAGFVETEMRLNIAGHDEATSFSYAADTRASNWHAGGHVKGMFKKIGFGVSGGYTSNRMNVNFRNDQTISRTAVDGTMAGKVRIEFLTSTFRPKSAPVTSAAA